MFNTFFFENSAVYELCEKIMYSRTCHRWEYIKRMRTACWMSKATSTQNM